MVVPVGMLVVAACVAHGPGAGVSVCGCGCLCGRVRGRVGVCVRACVPVRLQAVVYESKLPKPIKHNSNLTRHPVFLGGVVLIFLWQFFRFKKKNGGGGGAPMSAKDFAEFERKYGDDFKKFEKGGSSRAADDFSTHATGARLGRFGNPDL